MVRPAAAPGAVGVNVRLGSVRPGGDVVADLEAAGLHVERVLRGIRVVSGTVPIDGIERLAGIDGVTSVERDQVVSATTSPP